MRRAIPLIVLLALACGASAAADESPRRSYRTRHCGDGCPRIDGVPDEACWAQVDWATDFTEYRPDQGAAPSQQTAFKILYDDRHLYIAYRAYDDEPEKIVERLTRRDGFPGDWVEINIDSYDDRRTAYSFTASVSGVRGDEFISSDGDSWDGSWDPVWDFESQIDDEGWTAEVRIPLGQLRYQPLPEQTWGIQVQRRVFREEERSLWQPKHKEENGWVSRFGRLEGLVDLPVQRRIELLPYSVVRSERFEAEEGNPFNEGSDGKVALGLDGKIGVSSNLTLDFTINPDFGQVEADPSQLNLSAFETFFQERRPFFIEGSNILDFRIAPAVTGGRNTRDILFYSRRIGRRPGWPWDTRDYPDYVEMPEASSILGAFKLTGKTAGGLSIGVLESVTGKESARADYGAGEEEIAVEPATNFFASRLQQDFRDGDSNVGAMVTAVNRRGEPGLEFMHRQAYAGGLNFFSRFRNREWRVAGSALFSHVRGDSLAMANTQLSSARYFQRPDNEEGDYDPDRRDLSGHAGSLRVGRSKTEGFRFETQAGWRSPGFEINDLGYMREADVINQSTWVGWYKQPSRVLKSVGINSNQWNDYDFGGNLLRRMANMNTNLNFRSNMSLGIGATRTWSASSNTALRGGPTLRLPDEWDADFWFNSDHRKRFTYGFGGWLNEGSDNAHSVGGAWFSIGFRPTEALRVTLNPDYDMRDLTMQYVGADSFGGEDRYLFGSLDQETLSLTMRVDYAITPNLTVQLYGSPYVTAGRYRAFKRITNPQADRLSGRIHEFDEGEIAYDEGEGAYQIDEDSDGTIDYTIDDPDFNFRDFNSNLVIRWEFSPGSQLYLVWSQARNSFVGDGAFAWQDDMGDLFDTHPHNVFLLKVNKWLSL